MNHILLPGRASAGDFNLAARYGINTMEVLINSLMKLGVKTQRIIAKVFGGPKRFNHLENGLLPGMKNVEFVMDFLDLEKIPVIASDVGGEKEPDVGGNNGFFRKGRLSLSIRALTGTHD